MGAERRQFEREFSPRRDALLRVANTSFTLQILDESEGGLGCFAGDPLPITPHQVVAIDIEGSQPRLAIVRYLAPHARGGFHVGLQWQEVDAPLIVSAAQVG